MGINNISLPGGAFGQSDIEGAIMPISPFAHFGDKSSMPEIKGFQMPPPSQHFRVKGIAFFVFRQYALYCMKLPVFSQQMAAAQPLCRYVPYSHLTAPLRCGS